MKTTLATDVMEIELTNMMFAVPASSASTMPVLPLINGVSSPRSRMKKSQYRNSAANSMAPRT
jgi:hypothetical protein